MTLSLLGPFLLATSGQVPEPSPSPAEHTIYTVTPGISGFIAFFVLALIGWLLFRSLNRHVRKVDQEALRRGRQVPGEQEDAPEPGDGAAR